MKPFITPDSLSSDEGPWKTPSIAPVPRRGERRKVRSTWRAGGVGLISCAVLGILSTSVLGTPAVVVLAIIGDLTYAAAVLMFAIGFSRNASVVERKPLGVTALSVVALFPLVTTVLSQLLAPSRTPDSDPGWMIPTSLLLIVPAGAGLIAATQIGRAGIVPTPWQWAPLWVLAIHATTWAITQMAYLTLAPDTLQQLSGFFPALTTIAFLAGTLGLGILGLLITPPRPHTTNIYPSP